MYVHGKSPISLQELCCQLVVDSAQWRDLPKLILPADTYKYVEDYVSDKKERSRILAYMYTQFYDNSGVQKFDLRGLKCDIFIGVLDVENVVDLDLSNSSLPKACYVNVVTRAVNIQYLNLNWCITCDETDCISLIGNECLIAIAENCRKIVQLKILYTNVTLEGVRTAFKVKKSFLKLKRLYCGDIGDEDGVACEQIILEHTPALEVLKSENSMLALTSIWLDKNKFAVFCHVPFELRAVELSYDIPDVDILFYKDLKLMCPNLSRLHLNVSDFIGDSNFFGMGDLPSITKLYLEFDSLETIDDSKAIEKAALNILDACGSTVLKLKLWFDFQVRFRCIDILKRCLKLQKLDIQNYYGTDFTDGIRELKSNFPSLKLFRFEKVYCEKEFDEDLVVVCRLFPKLITLEISNATFRYSMPWCDLFLTKGMFSQLEECCFMNMVSPADYILTILKNIQLFPQLGRLWYKEKEGGRKALNLSEEEGDEWDWILDQANDYTRCTYLENIFRYRWF